MRIATTERRKGADGQWAEHTEWHSVVTWGKTAENCSQFLKKGRQVFIDGKIQTRKWQDQTGNTRYTTEVVANNVTFVGGGRGEGAGAGAPRGGGATELESSMPSYGGGEETLPAAAPVSFDDDDIPF